MAYAASNPTSVKHELSPFSPKTGSDEKLVAEAMMRLPQANGLMYRPPVSRYDPGVDHRISRQMPFNPNFQSQMVPQYDPNLPGRFQEGPYHTNNYGYPEEGSHSSDLRGRAENWTFEETRTFVKLLMDHAREFQNIRRHPSLWGILANKMAQSGFPRTIEKCKNRWKVLVAKYKKCHDEMKRQKPSPNSEPLTHSFEFYYQLETLLKPNYHIEADKIQRRHRTQSTENNANLIKVNSNPGELSQNDTHHQHQNQNQNDQQQQQQYHDQPSFPNLRPQVSASQPRHTPAKLNYMPYQPYSRLPNEYLSPSYPYHPSSMPFRPTSHIPLPLNGYQTYQPYPDSYNPNSYQDSYNQFPSVDPSPTTPTFPYPSNYH